LPNGAMNDFERMIRIYFRFEEKMEKNKLPVGES